MVNNFVILGGAGFIGINLILHLSKNNNLNIILVDNFQESFNLREVKNILKENKIFLKSIVFIKSDISNVGNYSKYLNKNTYLVHLAAMPGIDYSTKYPYESINQNLFKFIKILEICREKKIKKIILASSNAVLGESSYKTNENDKINPISIYGSSKASCEIFTYNYFLNYNLSSAILRFSNVYGPYSIYKNSVISKFIKQIFNNQKISIFGDGKQIRDYIYVEDLVKSILHVAKLKKKFILINICSGEKTNIKNLLNKMLIHFPDFNKRKNIKLVARRKEDIYVNNPDNSKLKKYIKFKFTKLEMGIDKTINWFKKVK